MRTLLFDIALPFKDPVFVFATLLVIILVMPILLKKIHIPGIVGLILAGVAIGPKGFKVIELDPSIKLLSTIGLLYIMFLAGLEIDFRDFQRNRNKSLVYGFLTFSIPLSIGTVTTLYVLNFKLDSSLLLASMYATHTLISYPIVSRLGVTKNEAVTITVGGTIVTDTAALLLLSFITAYAKGGDLQDIALKMSVSFAIFLLMVMGVFPRIARWFFKSVEAEGTSQYIFSLLVVFASAVMAELANIEPIIGAFMAGLVLNRLIPHSSVLMNRVNFIGNALFIPLFLVSVGMRVDLNVLFADVNSWKVAITIIVVAYVTKWIAAFLTQKIYHYSKTERQIIFGLGSSHAAATLAIILIGFDLKLFDASVLNGTILMILVTCLASTFITENAGKKLAVKELEKAAADTEGVERILVPVANPANFQALIDLAILIKNPKSQEPIYPLSVVNDDAESRKRILLNDKLFENAIAHARAAEVNVDVISRVDLNVAGGIIRAVKDLAISDVVIGWNGKPSAVDIFFGTIMSQVLQKTSQTVIVSKINQPINTFRRIIVVVPQRAELEAGFGRWLMIINRFVAQIGAKLTFYSVEQESTKLQEQLVKYPALLQSEFLHLPFWENIGDIAPLLRGEDLLIVVSARAQTLSYSKTMERLPRLLSDNFEVHSFLILFPEQASAIDTEGVSQQFVG
ncbi:MAG: cation:proton antiporter [Saprospiraceae bacterium]|nr:cation:proton antiporter [Saprospiraceae bacterium]